MSIASLHHQSQEYSREFARQLYDPPEQAFCPNSRRLLYYPALGLADQFAFGPGLSATRIGSRDVQEHCVTRPKHIGGTSEAATNAEADLALNRMTGNEVLIGKHRDSMVA